MKVKLQKVRIAFLVLFEPKTVNGEGDPAFSATFVIEPGSANAKALNAALAAVAKEKWADKAPAILKDLKAKGKVCYQEAAKTNASGEVYDGFEDMHFCSARSKTRPLVLDRDKSPLSMTDGKPYGGCYVNVSLDLWAQDNNFGKRVNASLKGVQFDSEGDAFGGGAPASSDEFDDLASDDIAA
jgi:hypothetical protein